MAGQAAAAKTSSGLSIGQVLAKLSNEFPELTPSKLRFLEEQGLINPDRTNSGYRKFAAHHVERIRLVLELQRDNYLPLKVIRRHLEDIDSGLEPAIPALPGSGGAAATKQKSFTRKELLRHCRAHDTLLDAAIAASLIAPAEHYGEATAAVLDTLRMLAGFGIEPRHLRALRASVERDAGLISSALRSSRGAKTRASAELQLERAKELATCVEQLRSSLLLGMIGG